MAAPASSTVLRFRSVGLRFSPSGVALIDVNWSVHPGERWVVLGANGSGKTSLLRLAYGVAFPSSGQVEVLGERMGRVDVRHLRRRIGYASGALTTMLRPGITALEVVLAAK